MSDEHVKQLKDFIFEALRNEPILKATVENKAADLIVFQSPLSLRLRKAGYIMLKHIYDHEKFELSEKLTGRELITLKKYISWPYYLPVDHRYIVLFTIRESFLLKLQGGNVKKWLEQIYEKNTKENKNL